MNLRTRILLGYWYLVGLVIVCAAAAALGFLRLGSNIGRVLDENFESVRASMMMLHALERQDSAVLASLVEEEGALESLHDSEAGFEDAVRRARENVTLDDEVPILDEIERRYAAFRAARDQLLAIPRERPLKAYETETFPQFEAVKEKVFELLELNHRSMVEADVRAQQAARLSAVGYGTLVLIALLSLAVLSQALGRVVLDRLTELGAVARAVAAGDRQRRAVSLYHDELGTVARQLNAVLDRLDELEGSVQGRLAQEREVVLGLLQALDRPAAFVSLTGAVTASTMSRADGAVVERAGTRLPTAASGTLPEQLSVDVEDGRVNLQLLRADGVRPVGWLATLDTSAEPTS